MQCEVIVDLPSSSEQQIKVKSEVVGHYTGRRHAQSSMFTSPTLPSFSAMEAI